MSNRIHEFLVRDDGTYSVFFITLLPVFLGISGLAIDAAIAYDWRAKLQVTADSAAHAAAIDLPNVDTAKETAHRYADKGIDPSTFGNVLPDANIEMGNWDEVTRTFTPNGIPVDAVRVTVQRTGSNGNPVATTLLRIIGVDGWDIAASAIAESSDVVRIVQ